MDKFWLFSSEQPLRIAFFPSLGNNIQKSRQRNPEKYSDFSTIELRDAIFEFSPKMEEGIKPFKVGKGRIVGILLTLSFLFPVAMSLNSKPTFHYSNMPRLMDELIEALVPPPPTEDAIAIKEGWFVDKYDEALEKAKSQMNKLVDSRNLA